MKHPCELIAASLVFCSWLGWHAFHGPIGKAGVHIVTVKVPDSCQQRSWPTSTGRCCRKLEKFQSMQVKICFFGFSFFSKVILWMSWVGSQFFSMLVVGIFFQEDDQLND